MMHLFEVPKHVSTRRAEVTCWIVSGVLALIFSFVGFGLHYFGKFISDLATH